MSKTNYHDPVLLQPSVAALITDPNGVYIDATFGGGGHSQAILKALSAQGRLFAFDRSQSRLGVALSSREPTTSAQLSRMDATNSCRLSRTKCQ